jgi:hypothetical protein
VVEALKQTWDVPLSKGGRVLALTLPEGKAKMAELVQRRTELNRGILAYEREN